MNCPRFQRLLEEYLDGTLRAGAKAAADKHLARCRACRQAVRQEQQVAQSLSGVFRQATGSMALRPEVQHRILTTLDHEPASFTAGEILFRLRRFRWSLATAAASLIATLLLIAFFFGGRNPSPERAEPRAGRSLSPVTIHVWHCVPTYTFRKEGDRVIDTLAYETNVMAVMLRVDQDPNCVQRERERKVPL